MGIRNIIWLAWRKVIVMKMLFGILSWAAKAAATDKNRLIVS